MNLNTPTGLGGASGLGPNKAAYLNFDIRSFEAMLTRAEQQVLPTAISNGLNRVAAVSRQEVQKAMDLQLVNYGNMREFRTATCLQSETKIKA
ncbi:hypothetical protein FHS77_003271 [Paenochrobactrum gallinarii]|uniref:Uncharacterized protein n=1 Tax=Paenochrobactrum gallinarii TaxID=643673 RepID=A0A841LWC4_9HYPH|nr:hypothetical protein [Paenochrobactrum gallinarii]MBB6262685.1 hypothetical protein [Paenochrobactrum gallinarii]